MVGPAALALVQPADKIALFIQIGVFFFLIGLEEIDIPSIFSVLKKRLFARTTVGFAVPFALAVTPLYTRTVLGELRVKDVYTKSPPTDRLRGHVSRAVCRKA